MQVSTPPHIATHCIIFKTKTMKPLTKLYIKTFLATGIPYGIIMMGFDYLEGTEFKLWKFLFLTFFFGITMSLILVYSQKKALKKAGINELTDKNLGVNQSKEIKTKFSKDEILNQLKSEKSLKKMEIEETENGINIATNTSWKSWGENICISLKSKEEQYYTYQISSSPKLKTTLLDYGKNLKNVTLLESIIKNIA